MDGPTRRQHHASQKSEQNVSGRRRRRWRKLLVVTLAVGILAFLQAKTLFFFFQSTSDEENSYLPRLENRSKTPFSVNNATVITREASIFSLNTLASNNDSMAISSKHPSSLLTHPKPSVPDSGQPKRWNEITGISESETASLPELILNSRTDWTRQHSQVLDRIINQRLSSISLQKQGGHQHLMFPPRLLLPPEHDPSFGNASDPLKHGIFFVGTGDIGFVQRRIVPAMQHMKRVLRIPRAKERAKLRQQYREEPQNTSAALASVSYTGFALLASHEFQTSPLLQPYLSFFDVIYDPAKDLPDWPKGWRQSLQSGKKQGQRGHAKANKAHALASSPFDVTVFMDFDTFPCRPNFMEPLLELSKNSDIALSNQMREMGAIPKTSDMHWMWEHNTAMVVMNMTSTRMKNLLGLYVEAFHAMWEIHPAGAAIPPRDQPAFMIALMALRRLREQHDNNHTMSPTKSFLDHVDIPHELFCRRLTTPEGQPMVCGGESACLLAHKPDHIVKGGRKRVQ